MVASLASGSLFCRLGNSASKNSPLAERVDSMETSERDSWKVCPKDTSAMVGMERLKFSLVLSAMK